jgi:hypothetical protein
MTPYRSQARNKDIEDIISDLSGRAEKELYDKIIVRTEGYKNNVQKDQSEEDRTKALSSIPPTHKVDFIQAITQVKSEVVYDNEDSDVIDWGENVTYRVKSELFDKGQFTIFSTLREPSQEQLENYNPSKFSLEKGQRKPITRVEIKLTPAVELFDSLVENVEGLVVQGRPVDVHNPSELSKINPYWKRSVVTAVLEAQHLDLGE